MALLKIQYFKESEVGPAIVQTDSTRLEGEAAAFLLKCLRGDVSPGFLRQIGILHRIIKEEISNE